MLKTKRPPPPAYGGTTIKHTMKHKRKAAAKTKRKTMRRKARPAAEMRPLDASKLVFPGVLAKHAPDFYGSSTIYIDFGNKIWRLKPKPADRKMKTFSWKNTAPTDAWTALVTEIKKINTIS
jgi:hypothetical protein